MTPCFPPCCWPIDRYKCQEYHYALVTVGNTSGSHRIVYMKLVILLLALLGIVVVLVLVMVGGLIRALERELALKR
jgi:hypothetical protein